MFKTRIIGIYQALSLFELFLSQAFYWLSLSLFRKYYTAGFYFDLYAYESCAFILLISMVVLFWKTDFQQVSLVSPSFLHSYRWSAHRALVGLVSILLYLFVTKNETVSRAFMFTHFGLQFLTILITHRYFPEFFATMSFKGRRRQNALLIGPLKKAIRMKTWIQNKGMLGIEPVGVICKDAEEGTLSGLKIISAREGIEKILKDLKIRQVILLELPERKSELAGLFSLFEKYAVRLVIVNDLEETLGHSVVMIEDDGLHLIGMRTEPLESPFNRGLKRVLDLLISLPVILLMMPPLMVLVSLFQRRQSPGPLFVSQARGGIQGQRFEMLKFRTMHPNHQTIAKQATKNDPRIYPAGGWLRK
ncbi:MAG: sugar transferase, partial [Verrucomicrobiota bacterium]